MNRSLWIAVVVAVVVLALAGAWLKSRSPKDAPKYRTAALEQGDITSTVSATGSVQPVLQVQVGSQVSGTLSRLYVDFNSRVKAGQVLGQIETSAFKARLAQAEAAVARAEAALKDGVRQYTRTQELQKGDYISQADVDAAEVAVEQRRADLKQATASLESAQVDLDHATIRSPIDGVVISRSIDVGQTVAASLQAPQLFVIANDLKQMRVETKIDEADIGRIRIGLPVQFTVDAFPDVNFTGTVSQVRLQPITESNVVTYTTVITTSNDDLRLRPGMTANVVVLVETHRDVLKVANAALRFKPQLAGVGGMTAGNGGASAAGGGVASAATSASADRGGVRNGAGRAPGAGDSTRAGHGPGGRGGMRGTTGGRPDGAKPGTIWTLRNGKPVRVEVMTGITDGAMTEIRCRELKAGDMIAVGVDQAKSAGTQLPPGMGGPQMRGPGGGRR